MRTDNFFQSQIMTRNPLESFIGETPLVALRKMGQGRGNTLLAKLEGNNPAGSVKDRPAVNMIAAAARRGEIRPGDRLIEATSGNTGIALAMAAAALGYRMTLVMPENQTEERKQTMRAFGAELILVTRERGMEGARDLALEMEKNGQGRVLNQFANPDNPAAHYNGTAPEIWRDTGEKNHPLRLQHGHHRNHHRLLDVFQGKEPRDSDCRRAARRGRANSGHPQMAGGVSPGDFQDGESRPRN